MEESRNNKVKGARHQSVVTVQTLLKGVSRRGGVTEAGSSSGAGGPGGTAYSVSPLGDESTRKQTVAGVVQ